MTAARPRLRLAFRGPGAVVAMATLVLFLLAGTFAGLLSTHDPRDQPGADSLQNQPPSAQHFFGTDQLSRDVYSRFLYGARTTLGVGVASVLVAVTLGVLVGASAGFFGGWFDAVAMRFVDAMLSVPRLLLLIVLRATIGRSLTVLDLILLLGLTGWPAMSRIVRAEARALRERDFVEAARAAGARQLHILFRHVIPGVTSVVIVAGTLALATVIPLEAGLSYLGLGVASPTPSWGNIIQDSDRFGTTWWLVLFPGAAIVCIVLAVNTLGDRLRGVLDPRQERWR